MPAGMQRPGRIRGVRHPPRASPDTEGMAGTSELLALQGVDPVAKFVRLAGTEDRKISA